MLTNWMYVAEKRTIDLILEIAKCTGKKPVLPENIDSDYARKLVSAYDVRAVMLDSCTTIYSRNAWHYVRQYKCHAVSAWASKHSRFDLPVGFAPGCRQVGRAPVMDYDYFGDAGSLDD